MLGLFSLCIIISSGYGFAWTRRYEHCVAVTMELQTWQTSSLCKMEKCFDIHNNMVEPDSKSFGVYEAQPAQRSVLVRSRRSDDDCVQRASKEIYEKFVRRNTSRQTPRLLLPFPPGHCKKKQKTPLEDQPR